MTKETIKYARMIKITDAEKDQDKVQLSLKKYPDQTCRELAKRINWTDGKVYKILKKLIKEGLVERNEIESKDNKKVITYNIIKFHVLDATLYDQTR